MKMPATCLICLCLFLFFKPLLAQNLELKDRIDTAISRINIHIKNWTCTPKALITNEFRFDSVIVSGIINLYDIEFTNRTRIINCVFHPDYSFYHGRSKPETGEGVLFDNYVIFKNDTFLQASDFRSGRYLKRIRFENNYFRGIVDFTYSHFDDTASFKGTDFGDNAHFVMASFGKYADFTDCHFGRIAFFSDLVLSEAAEFSFKSATLPDTIDFSNNSFITRTIDFIDASLDDNKKHYIFLDGTDISKINLDYAHFKLLFKDPKYPENKELDPDRKESIYEGLLANFKTRGQWESYNQLNGEYENFKVSRMSLMDKLWFIYASSPFHVISVTLIFFCILSFINVYYYKDLNNKVYAIKYFGPEVANKPILKKQSLTLKEFSHSAIYTAFVFFTFTIKTDELHFKYRKLLAWFFTIYILGLIALFFLTHLLFK
jgi:uncharacterized protein YjbI with pentapeptide repeats